MITTLLKHEWLRTRGLIAAIAGIAILAVTAATALVALDWTAVSGLGMVLGVFALGALVPAMQIGLAVDFWNSSFRRTGYFTQSLPIRGTTIFAAKAIWGSIVTLASIVLAVLLLALLWLPTGPNILGVDANLLALIGELFDMVPAWASIGAIAFLAVSMLGALAQLYFAATLGSGRALGRLGIGGPVIVYIATYVAGQILTMVGMLAVPLGIGFAHGELGLVRFSLIDEMATGANTDDIMPIGFIAPLLIIFIAVTVWSAQHWRKRISLA